MSVDTSQWYLVSTRLVADGESTFTTPQFAALASSPREAQHIVEATVSRLNFVMKQGYQLEVGDAEAI